ncbi:MAG: ArnT family glycosyltransferase [Bacteroidia bacterium]
MVEQGNYMVPYYENKPDMWNTKPLFLTWSIITSTKIFGQNEFGVRFPSALSAYILAIFIFIFFTNYLKDIVGATISSLSLVSFYGFVEYHVARNGDFDSMLTMFTFIATTLFFIGFHKNKSNLILLGGLVLTFAFLTKGIAAGIVLPGAFLYFISKKNGFKLLVQNKIILITSLAIIFSFSYYLLREYSNPDFLSIVFNNEIANRYLQSAEGHGEKFSFYFISLYERGVDGWFFCIIASSIITIFNESKVQKQFFYYTLFVCFLFLLIHSISSTKLPWYIAPAYPHFAIIIGLGFSTLVQKTKRILPIIASKEYGVYIILFPLLLFYFKVPYKNINNTSVKANREGTYPELFFGNRISDYLSKTNSNKKVSVVHQSYNSSLEYYYLKYKLEGFDISKKYYEEVFELNEILLICESPVLIHLEKFYLFNYVINENNYWVIQITKIKETPITQDEIADGFEKLKLKSAEIINTPDWYKSIQEKAKKNNISFDEQLKRDVIWVLENDKVITPKTAQYLTNH